MANPETVVDYTAWKKGYLPPSEHLLIDALAYRGAKVMFSSDNGEGKGAIWIVMRDRRPPRKYLRALMSLLYDCLEDEEPSVPYEYETADC